MVAVAEAIALSLPARQPARQLLVDVTRLTEGGRLAKIKPKLLAMLRDPPPGFRAEPIYMPADGSSYHYARGFSLSLLGGSCNSLQDDVIEIQQADRYLALFPEIEMSAKQLEFVGWLRRQGLDVGFSDVPAEVAI